MSTSRRSPWSWAALVVWLGQSILAAAMATAMLFGPELADRAWDRGVHVTPAQAAMHFALTAQGFSHHHGQAQHAATHSVAAGSAPAVEASSPPPDWGTPFTQTIESQPGCCQTMLTGLLTFRGQLWPASLDLAPPAPPPRALSF